MIIRTNKAENPFVQIDKTGIEDQRLSWKARGILCYLLSKPDNWEVNIQNLQNNATDGRDSCRAGLKELEKFGYMIKHQKHNDQGHFHRVEYLVFETPEMREKWEQSTADGKSGSGGSGAGSGQDEAGNGKTEGGKPVNGGAGDGKSVDGGEKSAPEEYKTANGFTANGKTADGLTANGLTADGKSNTNNNIYTTIKDGNNKKNLKKREAEDFDPPSVEACKKWLLEHKDFDDAIAESIAWNFWSFYEQKNWMIGQNNMSNWEVALGRSLGWEQNKKLISAKNSDLISIARANELFHLNDLGGTNGTGIDFYEVFKKVGKKTVQLREGKRHLIQKWG